MQDREAVTAGEQEVEQDQLAIDGEARSIPAGGAVVGFKGVKVIGLERIDQPATDRGVIFDHEDADGRRHSR